jgi:hypothetical protein
MSATPETGSGAADDAPGSAIASSAPTGPPVGAHTPVTLLDLNLRLSVRPEDVPTGKGMCR